MPDCTLLHGDCLALLPTLPAQSVDLVLADLPYGTTACKWDSVLPLDVLWREYRRVLKPRGAVVLTGVQPFTSVLVMSNLEWFKYTWVWEKTVATNFLNAPNRPLTSHEDIVVFSPGKIGNGTHNRMNYNPQMDTSKGPWQKKVGLYGYGNGRDDGVFTRGGRQWYKPGTVRGGEVRHPRSVLKVANGNYGVQHPTQKPVALMAYLIRTYSNPGDTVLDNTMGSGTTGVAALQEGRAFIGMEQDAGYYRIACERIAAVDPLWREGAA
jgi:DNA modification methylase